MGRKATEWERQSQMRADEVCRALARVGVMTNGQIARLLKVDPRVARNLVYQHWDRFEIQRKVPRGIAGGRYVIPGNRVMNLVRLSDETMRSWAEREGIERTRNRMKPAGLGQALNVAEIAIRLRHQGVLYDKWDTMLPQGAGEGLHAILMKREGGAFRIGLYVLPMRLTEVDEGKKGFIFHGTLRRVVQNSTVTNTLFLVTHKYYAAALQALTHVTAVGRQSYLLPLESFMQTPEFYLEAIANGERTEQQALVDEYLYEEWDEKHVVPVEYNYAALLGFTDGRYRFVDTYVNGSIDRVRDWKANTLSYQIPKTGHMATAEVYVYDDAVRDALTRLLQTRTRGQYEGSIVETKPWPAEQAAMDESRQPTMTNNSVLDDDDWWKVFNE